MLKDEKNRSYNGGRDARPLKIWPDFFIPTVPDKKVQLYQVVE